MYVYVISCAAYHKVGMARDPLRRMREMQVGNPFEMRIIRTFEVADYMASSIEARTHTVLREYHVRGEWFSAPEAMVLAAVESSLGNNAVTRSEPREDRRSPTAPRCKICQQRHFGAAHIYTLRKMGSR